MLETIHDGFRKARKRHKCNYCGKPIEPGETYNYAFIKFDGVYEWKSHPKCLSIATDLWDYIDPNEGMTQEDFQDGCTDFCRAFVCPDCASWDVEAEECRKDEEFCIDKIHEILQTHDLCAKRDRYGFYVFKLVPRESEDSRGERKEDEK